MLLLAYLGLPALDHASRVLCSRLQQAIPHEGHRQALGVLGSKDITEKEQQGQCLIQETWGLHDREDIDMGCGGS